MTGITRALVACVVLLGLMIVLPETVPERVQPAWTRGPHAGALESASGQPGPKAAEGVWQRTKTWTAKTVDWGNCDVVPTVQAASPGSARTASTPGKCEGGRISFKHAWAVPPQELKEGQVLVLDLSVDDAGTVWGKGKGRGYTAVFLGNYGGSGSNWKDVHIPGMMDYACQEKDSGPLWEGKSLNFSATSGAGWSHDIKAKIPVQAAWKGAASLCRDAGKTASKKLTVPIPKGGASKKFLLIVVAGHGSRVTLDQGPREDTIVSTAGAHATTYYEYSFAPPLQITGRITGKRADDEPGNPIHPAQYPIAGAAVTLLKKGEPFGTKTAATGEDGSYVLGIDGPAEDLAIRVELKYAGLAPSPFLVVQDAGADPIGAKTKPFAVPVGTTAPIVKDVVLGRGDDVIPLNTEAGRLYDAGLIYKYTEMAWRFIQNDLVGPVPALAFNPPLVVRAFATDATSVEQDAYGDMEKPEVAFSVRTSESANQLRPGTIWHEIGHTVQGVMTQHHAPVLKGTPGFKGYHAGFENADTAASFIEGFATFFAAQVATRAGGFKPGEIDVNGCHRILSFPEHMPWDVFGVFEEIAVASLLWDLVDADEEEFTQQSDQKTVEGFVQSISPPFLAGKSFRRTFRDRVQIGLGEFFQILSAKGPVEPVAYPGATTGVWDVRQLYAVLEAMGKGRAADRGARAAKDANELSPLDEVFVMHGFFADAVPKGASQNFVYDEGEKVGYAANGGTIEYYPDNVGDKTIYRKIEPRFSPLRRVPPPPFTVVAARLVDATGRAVAPRDFEVEVKYGPPYEAYGYTFKTRTATPGRLPVLCASPAIPSTTTIRPLDDHGMALPAAVTFTGDQYWAALRTAKDRVIASHDFAVDVLPNLPPAPGEPPPPGGKDTVRERPPEPVEPGTGGAVGSGGTTPFSSGGSEVATIAAIGLIGLAVVLGVAIVIVRRRSASPATPGLRIQASLSVVYADGGRKEFALSRDVTTIGRDRGNLLVLNDQEVSSQHAVLTVTNQGFVLRDVGSANGTWVNGQRIDEEAVFAGDDIQLGMTKLTLH